MATEAKSTGQISESLIREMTNSARMLGKLSEHLSNAGLDKFAKEIKISLKQHKLINDELESQIKTGKDLQQVLNKLEDNFIDVTKAIDKLDGKIKALSRNNDAASKAQLKKLHQDRQELSLRHSGMERIRDEISERSKNIKASDKLGRSFGEVTSGTKRYVAALGSAAVALNYFKKALVQGYDDMLRLTNKGMLGAFTEIQSASFRLQMIPAELEAIIDKNRLLVNSFGGGAVGIKAFIGEIQEARQGLEHLGRDSAKAGARFITLSQMAGLTKKDGVAYSSNLKSTNKQFKEFSVLYGDTFDQYATLYEELTNEETLRRKLNGLSKTDLSVEMESLRLRTAEQRALGFTIPQIVEMGKKAGALLDPRKNNITERIQQSAMAKLADSSMMRMLGSDPKNADLMKRFQGSRGALDELYNAVSSGASPQQLEAIRSKKSVADALKTREDVKSATDSANQFSRLPRNEFLRMSGGLEDFLSTAGQTMQTASARNTQTTAEVRASALANIKASKNVESAFNLLSRTVGFAESATKSALGSLVIGIGGAAIGLAGFAVQLKLASLAASRLGATMSGTEAIRSGGKGMGMLGKAGVLGSVGLASYGIASIANEHFGISDKISGMFQSQSEKDANNIMKAQLTGNTSGMSGLNSDTRSRFLAMAAEYGRPIQVNSSYRSRDEQSKLYQENIANGNPKKVAAPGRSPHNHGIALDIQSTDANALASKGLLEKYGFSRPVSGEPWHIQSGSTMSTGGETSEKGDPYGDVTVPELKRQTEILMRIAENTGMKMRPAADAYLPTTVELD